jgi:hypothetical protein
MVWGRAALSRAAGAGLKAPRDENHGNGGYFGGATQLKLAASSTLPWPL